MDREERAEAVRPIVEEAVRRSSLRKVAAEIGVSHGTLRNFLDKAYTPFGDTLYKIEQWAARVAPQGVVRQEDEEGFESLLYSRSALYQTLSSFGGPGERTDDKLSLIDLLSKVAADLRREGRRLPVEILSEAHADILRGKI